MREIISPKFICTKLHIRKFRSAIVAALIFVVIMSVTVFAKFIAQKDTHGKIFDRNVATYYMEILGDDAITKLSERILVDEMNPGEIREVDLYISNGNSEKVSQVDMTYEIEIIHTVNMPLVFELYDSEGNLLVGESMEEGIEVYQNDGTRSVYTMSADSEKMILHINKGNSDKITSDKYTLKVIWNDDMESSDFKYVKEIDFLYINVYAYQSEPVKE